ncbi:MAG: cytotoxic translational repressor of toxin-antitoxin stability system [Actinomycetota bacterium]|nr:cytotoxic translational repressor of toxin-antitoxin stability system [Actinomycetota bacterium]
MKPLPHSAHRKFVETEGWEKKGTARGSGKTGDHYRYNLRLATGDMLTTRVSRGSGQINDPKLIAAIYRDQLAVCEEDFWRCVDDGVLPPRPQPPPALAEGDLLDAKLVRNLIRRVGLTEAEIATFTKADAVARWEQYLSEGGT